jgi:hypothetical protein
LTRPPMRTGSESGQTILIVAVALGLFMLGALGLGIDGAQMYAHRQMAQAAADAAAQAAMMSILRGTNATSAHPFSTAGPFTCAVPPAALDLRVPCIYAQYNGFGTSADTVIVSFPAAVAGVALFPGVSAPAVSVRVQRVLTTGLIRFAGPASATIGARASSGIVPSVPPTCLYVLDPQAQNSFTMTNGTVASMDCAIVINSSNGTAATLSGGATLAAPAISVRGGFVLKGGATVSPSLTSGTQPALDPFAAVAAPAAGSCNQTNYQAGSGNWTLNPGTYCGGIVIDHGGTASFNPGTYVIQGGGIHFGGGASITGSGVMFYLTGTNSSYGSVIMDNGVTVNLSAQTSGAYMGLLFYQDRSITSNVNASFAGGASSRLSGSLYFPTTAISFSNGTTGTGNTALVARQVSLVGGARLNYDATGQKTGLTMQTVGLIE